VTLTLLASAESATIAWLLAQSEIADVVGTRAQTSLVPGQQFPMLRVRRVSGVGDEYWRDLPRVQIECWGDVEGEGDGSESDAMDLLARTVAACVERAAGRVGPIGGMEVAYGPARLDDPDTNRVRYLLDVTFAAHEE
jgi:hypothetical protein